MAAPMQLAFFESCIPISSSKQQVPAGSRADEYRWNTLIFFMHSWLLRSDEDDSED